MPFFNSFVEDLKLRILERGSVVCLNGPLGAGKTTFTKELLSAFGFPTEEVQSPTFLKLLEYEVSRQGLCLHLDGYRMTSSSEYSRLGLEAYEQAWLWIVEWPEFFVEYLESQPSLRRMLGIKNYINVAIDPVSGATARIVTIEEVGFTNCV